MSYFLGLVRHFYILLPYSFEHLAAKCLAARCRYLCCRAARPVRNTRREIVILTGNRARGCIEAGHILLGPRGRIIVNAGCRHSNHASYTGISWGIRARGSHGIRLRGLQNIDELSISALSSCHDRARTRQAPSRAPLHSLRCISRGRLCLHYQGL